MIIHGNWFDNHRIEWRQPTSQMRGPLHCLRGQAGRSMNYLRGVTPDGSLYARPRLNLEIELAGACFPPDGQVMFVTCKRPGHLGG